MAGDSNSVVKRSFLVNFFSPSLNVNFEARKRVFLTMEQMSAGRKRLKRNFIKVNYFCSIPHQLHICQESLHHQSSKKMNEERKNIAKCTADPSNTILRKVFLPKKS